MTKPVTPKCKRTNIAVPGPGNQNKYLTACGRVGAGEHLWRMVTCVKCRKFRDTKKAGKTENPFPVMFSNGKRLW